MWSRRRRCQEQIKRSKKRRKLEEDQLPGHWTPVIWPQHSLPGWRLCSGTLQTLQIWRLQHDASRHEDGLQITPGVQITRSRRGDHNHKHRYRHCSHASCSHDLADNSMQTVACRLQVTRTVGYRLWRLQPTLQQLWAMIVTGAFYRTPELCTPAPELSDQVSCVRSWSICNYHLIDLRHSVKVFKWIM